MHGDRRRPVLGKSVLPDVCPLSLHVLRAFFGFPHSNQIDRTGHSHTRALAYSAFLGLVGADRFYLGYHALGVAKLLTGGFFFFGYYLDLILIGTQMLLPADGSDYSIPLNGPVMSPTRLSDATYRVPL